MSQAGTREQTAPARRAMDLAVPGALAGVAALVALATRALPAVPQPQAYHRFADARVLLGVPNAMDVLSNAAFVLVGALGLVALRRRAGAAASPGRPAWRVLFWGVVATGLGSAWYHLAPRDATLVWDRLPMAVAFMALVSALVAEKLSPELGRRLLVPLVAGGSATVLYWYATELRGAGNLVPYLIVQLGSLAAIPVVLAVGRGGERADWLLALGLYAAAKVLEDADAPVYEALGVSGHTLKHLVAAAGIAWLVRMLARRPDPSRAAAERGS